MKSSKPSQKDYPFIYLTITWLFANAYLKYMYTTQVYMQMVYLYVTSLVVYQIKFTKDFYQSWTFCKKWSGNIKSKTNLIQQSNEPVDEYKKMVQINTQIQLKKLIQSQQYKKYLKQKSQQQRQGKIPQVIMCTVQTAIDMIEDILHLERLEQYFFGDKQ